MIKAEDLEQDLEIRRTLVLSTGHLQEETALAWDRARKDTEDAAYMDRVSFGYLVWAGDLNWNSVESDEHILTCGLPVEVRAAVKLALAHGCTYVCYDADGPMVSALVEHCYDW